MSPRAISHLYKIISPRKRTGYYGLHDFCNILKKKEDQGDQVFSVTEYSSEYSLQLIMSCQLKLCHFFFKMSMSEDTTPVSKLRFISIPFINLEKSNSLTRENSSLWQEMD